jgi:multidrug resistance protein
MKLSIKNFVLLMTIFIDATGFAMIIPLLPFYIQQFNVGAIGLGLLLFSFALMQFIFSPIMGRLSDKYGRRPLLLFSIFTSTLSFTFFTLAINYPMLLLSRISAGIATEVSVAQAYMSDITTDKKRTAGMGKVGAAFAAGVVIGPAFGGLLSTFGYWAPGLLAIVLSIINLIFVYIFLPEPEKIHQESKLQGGLGARTGFITNLKKALKRPLLPLLFLVFFSVNLAFSAIPVVIPLFTEAIFGFDEIQMGFLFVYIGSLQMIMQGFLIGKLSDKIGEGKLIIMGSVLVTIGLSFISFNRILFLFFILLGFMSLGNGLIRTSSPSIISQTTPRDEQGGFLGVLQSIASIALIPGPLIAGFLYDYVSINAPFIFSAILLFIATLISIKVYLQFNNLKKEQEKPQKE